MDSRRVEIACAIEFRKLGRRAYGSCLLQTMICKEIFEEYNICKPKLIFGYASDNGTTYIRHFWLEYDKKHIDPSTLSLPYSVRCNRHLSKIKPDGVCLTSEEFQCIQKNSYEMCLHNNFWKDLKLKTDQDTVVFYKILKMKIIDNLKLIH
jgi:hypothetical protein